MGICSFKQTVQHPEFDQYKLFLVDLNILYGTDTFHFCVELFCIILLFMEAESRHFSGSSQEYVSLITA